DPHPAPAAPAPPSVANPAPPIGTQPEYTPAELWAAVGGMSHMDRMEKFPEGVTVNATVTKILEPAGGEYAVEADAGTGRVLAITFADFGAIAKAKPLKVGDSIKATKCQLTNVEGSRLAIVQCELK
nr:hypothetical protein [Myxococcota bacterium]